MDILLAIAIMALGAVVLGAALGFASIKFKVEGDPLVEKINSILPQTQCGQCGFPGCKPYSEAIAKGEVDINLCPPGGLEGVQRLADLLGREVKPLEQEERPKQIAIIDENTCIGCTLCIQACPVDAIVGAAKQMHTIITPLCTGCELCLPPCPVECIRMEAITENLDNWKWKFPVVEIKFKGGVKPPTNKTQSLGLPIAQAPLPSRLVVPLHQSIGGMPRPVVKAGDKVLKGQLIGQADGWISAAVHAPTSGTVLEVALHVQPHPSGLDALCVVIEPDGRDQWIERTALDYQAMTPEQVREHLQQSGVVGLGGAVFPTHGKLTASKTVPMEEMVINGAECEPFITCDDLLMRERAEEVVRGIGIFRDLLQPKKVLIGIEDNKPEAAAAMRAAVSALNEKFDVVQVPTLYPAGGAKQLIRVLTGKEVPASKRSTDLGVQCFNVATAYTAWRAIAHGEPVVSRLVTVSGNVDAPRNYEVLIGTPMDESWAAR